MTSLEAFLLDVYRGELLTLGFRSDCVVRFDRDDVHFGGCDSVQVTVKSRQHYDDHVNIETTLHCGMGHVLENRVSFYFRPVPWILEGKQGVF